MNKLPSAKRAQILQLMVEGVSIRAITRLTGASKNTIAKLLVDAGQCFADYQGRTLRNVASKRVQVDEIWAFCYAKAKNVPTAKAAPEGAGDIWTWTAIDADSKLMLSWFVGGRDAYAASMFIRDVAGRLANRIQLTSDGLKTYLSAVERSFGNDIDYAMLVKHYGAGPDGPQTRYSPAQCTGITVGTVAGQPDEKHISTSYVERSNLSIRMGLRRFTRLTNAFSKKAENHAHALAIYFMHYNFVRQHKTLRTSPAMAAGVETKLWEMSDMVKLLEAWEAEGAE
jgi:IS1 family transposase